MICFIECYRIIQQNILTRHKRDWIHVHDVARAICYLIPDKFRGVLDIGTGILQMKLFCFRISTMRMGKSDLPISRRYRGLDNSEPDSIMC